MKYKTITRRNVESPELLKDINKAAKSEAGTGASKNFSTDRNRAASGLHNA